MKRKTVLAAGLVATLVGVAAIPALSHGTGQGWSGMGWNSQGSGPGTMMDNDGDEGGPGYGQMGPGYGRGMPGGGPGAMMGYGGQGGPGFMGGEGGYGMMGRMMAMHGGAGFGPMGGQGTMGALFQKFDSNGDGTVTPDELRAGLSGELKQYDKNGDGTLSLDEFAAFYADITRTAMVRHFQALDADGNGQISATEMTAPADRMEQMQKFWQSQRGDGTAMPGAGMMNESK